MKTNINQVAEKAGVSIATVSRAFKENGLVKPATRIKILQIAKELDYTPSPIARGLSTHTTDTIGVILPDLSGEFFMSIIHGIDEEANVANRYTLVSSSHSQRNTIETIIEFMTSGRVDGVILMAPKMHREIAEMIAKSKRPIVLINASKDLSGVVNFRIDNYQGAFASVEHLASHGYKNIAMIKGPDDNCDAQDRFAGFMDAADQHNLNAEESYIINGDFSPKAGYYGFMRLMSQRNKPDAVFCANDMTALGAYDAASKLQLKIPDDVALVGFDDIFLSKLLNPRLTTVHVPIEELGSKAVKYLLKMIDGEIDPGQPYTEVLSTGLVVGGSCGCRITHSFEIY